MNALDIKITDVELLAITQAAAPDVKARDRYRKVFDSFNSERELAISDLDCSALKKFVIVHMTRLYFFFFESESFNLVKEIASMRIEKVDQDNVKKIDLDILKDHQAGSLAKPFFTDDMIIDLIKQVKNPQTEYILSAEDRTPLKSEYIITEADRDVIKRKLIPKCNELAIKQLKELLTSYELPELRISLKDLITANQYHLMEDKIKLLHDYAEKIKDAHAQLNLTYDVKDMIQLLVVYQDVDFEKKDIESFKKSIEENYNLIIKELAQEKLRKQLKAHNLPELTVNLKEDVPIVDQVKQIESTIQELQAYKKKIKNVQFQAELTNEVSRLYGPSLEPSVLFQNVDRRIDLTSFAEYAKNLYVTAISSLMVGKILQDVKAQIPNFKSKALPEEDIKKILMQHKIGERFFTSFMMNLTGYLVEKEGFNFEEVNRMAAQLSVFDQELKEIDEKSAVEEGERKQADAALTLATTATAAAEVESKEALASQVEPAVVKKEAIFLGEQSIPVSLFELPFYLYVLANQKENPELHLLLNHVFKVVLQLSLPETTEGKLKRQQYLKEFEELKSKIKVTEPKVSGVRSIHWAIFDYLKKHSTQINAQYERLKMLPNFNDRFILLAYDWLTYFPKLLGQYKALPIDINPVKFNKPLFDATIQKPNAPSKELQEVGDVVKRFPKMDLFEMGPEQFRPVGLYGLKLFELMSKMGLDPDKDKELFSEVFNLYRFRRQILREAQPSTRKAFMELTKPIKKLGDKFLSWIKFGGILLSEKNMKRAAVMYLTREIEKKTLSPETKFFGKVLIDLISTSFDRHAIAEWIEVLKKLMEYVEEEHKYLNYLDTPKSAGAKLAKSEQKLEALFIELFQLFAPAYVKLVNEVKKNPAEMEIIMAFHEALKEYAFKEQGNMADDLFAQVIQKPTEQLAQKASSR